MRGASPHTYACMTINNSSDLPRIADGTFTNKGQGTPELASFSPNGRGPSFDDKYTAVPASPAGDLTFQTYADALAAAGGDEKRVWTLVDGEYEAGNKIWKFDYDGDEMIVGGESVEEATEQAMANLNENYEVDEDDEDEDNPPVSEDVLNLEGVYFGDLDDLFDEDEWEPAASRFAEAGHHLVNRYGFAVSVEPWSDGSETLPWI